MMALLCTWLRAGTSTAGQGSRRHGWASRDPGGYGPMQRGGRP